MAKTASTKKRSLFKIIGLLVAGIIIIAVMSLGFLLYSDARYLSPNYEGETLLGIPHGEGTYAVQDVFFGDKRDETYRGEFRFGSRTGQGEKISIKDDYTVTETGTFLSGILTGHGKKVRDSTGYPKYTITEEGKFLDRKLNGQGTRITEREGGETHTEKGEFLNGKLNGNGTFAIEYQSEYKSKDNVIYVGRFVEGAYNGRGTYELPNRSFMMEGRFENNILNGTGVLVLNGDRYEGDFINNRPNGKGTVTTRDGTTMNGTFKNGQLDENMSYTCRMSNGASCSGTFFVGGMNTLRTP